ncbi:MAG: cyclic nucleotide-binding domain-containing protein [Alphaproteobacteria bacterium]|nr:cyclic nucleotide-binding domain-containing protein [Alphaproteobacteria bacterium]
MNLVTLLARCPLLSHLPLRAIADLSRSIEPRELPPGAMLFEPGDPASTLFIVAQGQLELLDRGGDVLGHVEPDQFIGEAAVLLPSTHTIRCRVSQPSLILSLSRADVDALWERLPPVAALVEMALASWIMRDLESANQGLLSICDFTLGEVAHLGLREMLMNGTFSGKS